MDDLVWDVCTLWICDEDVLCGKSETGSFSLLGCEKV